MSEIPIGGITPVYFAEMPGAAVVIPALVAAFEREKDADDIKRTHMFAGRFENIYVPRQRLPELSALSDFVLAAASQILHKSPLRHGFWFNEMHSAVVRLVGPINPRQPGGWGRFGSSPR